MNGTILENNYSPFQSYINTSNSSYDLSNSSIQLELTSFQTETVDLEVTEFVDFDSKESTFEKSDKIYKNSIEESSKQLGIFEKDKNTKKSAVKEKKSLEELSNYLCSYASDKLKRKNKIKEQNRQKNQLDLENANKKLEKKLSPEEVSRLKRINAPLSYHKKRVKELPKDESILSIKSSTLSRQYGQIFNPKKEHKECLHCEESNHDIKIFSNSETNKLINLFQKAYLEVRPESKKQTMIGSATVKYQGKLLASYITHSGTTKDEMKEIYAKINAKILDYKSTQSKKTSEQKIASSNRNNNLYAIHSDDSLAINNGRFITLYGKEVKQYKDASKMQESIDQNFAGCAGQKILQQIAKDFSSEISEGKEFEINMSEAWIQHGMKKNKKWSQIHPVHSCEACLIVLPRSLCKN